MQPKVAVWKTSPATVLQDYQHLLELADAPRYLQAGVETILKNNISWHFPYPGANTTPWQLEGTIRALRHLGYQDLTCVQNRTVVTNAFKGETLNRYVPVFRKYDVPVKYNFRKSDMHWIRYQPQSDLAVLPSIFPKGIRIPDYFVGKNVVHLPTTKCHIYTTTTGSMKNAFGGLLGTDRHYCHSHIHQTLVDLLRIQQEIHPGIFTVMDGTTAGNGPGPRTMIPVEKDFILASGDSVAIDAVAAHMMGFDPMEIDYIRLAHEAGLGVGRMAEIEIVGEDVRDMSYQFHVGDNAASTIGDLMWFGPLRYLQRLFFQTPLVYAFIFGSYLYHDKLWYPLKGKVVVNHWCEQSKWGQLFQTYR